MMMTTTQSSSSSTTLRSDHHNHQQQQQQQQLQRPATTRSSSSSSPSTPATPGVAAVVSYPRWHNVIAGAVAGAGARLATAPLDIIRIRAQLERNVTYPRPSMWSSLVTIYQGEGGILALFRGSVAATYLWIGYSMVQFSVYAHIKEGLEHQQQQHHLGSTNHGMTMSLLLSNQLFTNPTAIAFLAGAGAGVCATISTYPFDICRTIFAAKGVIPTSATATTTTTTISSGSARITTTTATTAATATTNATTTFKPPTSLLECSTSMYRQNGFRSFFVGVNPAVMQIIPYMGLNFAIYDYLTQGDKRIGLSGYAGSISGAISKMIVYPMDTVKKRIQVQSVFGVMGTAASTTTTTTTTTTTGYTGMMDCLTTMIRQEGVMSLYRGLLPSVLKTTIGSGLSFAFFRMSKNILEEIHDQYHFYYRTNNSNSSSIK